MEVARANEALRRTIDRLAARHKLAAFCKSCLPKRCDFWEVATAGLYVYEEATAKKLPIRLTAT